MGIPSDIFDMLKERGYSLCAFYPYTLAKEISCLCLSKTQVLWQPGS